MAPQVKLFFLANNMMFSVGSEPMERKQTSGTRVFDSAHISSIFKITPSAN
jgi:hypothetical protein